jgi:hypothetical protein
MGNSEFESFGIGRVLESYPLHSKPLVFICLCYPLGILGNSRLCKSSIKVTINLSNHNF